MLYLNENILAKFLTVSFVISEVPTVEGILHM